MPSHSLKILSIVIFNARRGILRTRCTAFRRIFYAKHTAGEILFQDEGALDLYERPFSNHKNNNRGVWHVITVSSGKRDSEGDVPMQLEGELDLHKLTQRVQNLF